MRVEGERQGFVNMISSKLNELERERFAASRVRHPLITYGEVIVDADDCEEAKGIIAHTCSALVDDIDALLDSLNMPSTPPASFESVPLPVVTVQ